LRYGQTPPMWTAGQYYRGYFPRPEERAGQRWRPAPRLQAHRHAAARHPEPPVVAGRSQERTCRKAGGEPAFSAAVRAEIQSTVTSTAGRWNAPDRLMAGHLSRRYPNVSGGTQSPLSALAPAIHFSSCCCFRQATAVDARLEGVNTGRSSRCGPNEPLLPAVRPQQRRHVIVQRNAPKPGAELQLAQDPFAHDVADTVQPHSAPIGSAVSRSPNGTTC